MVNNAWLQAYSSQQRRNLVARRLTAEAKRLEMEIHHQRTTTLRRTQVNAVLASNAGYRMGSLVRLLADRLRALKEVDRDDKLCMLDPTDVRRIEAIARLCPTRHPLAVLVSDMLAFEPKDPDQALFDLEMLRRAQRRARN